MSVLRRLRQLEKENGRLKRLVADLSLDTHRLSEALRKKSKARTPTRTGWLVAGYLPGQLPAGLPIGPIQSRGLVSTESRHGSIWSPASHSRSGPCPPAIWVSADLGVVETRRLAGESQTGAAAVSTRWPTAADASATAEAYRVASGSSPDPDWSDGTLEHGFCA